MARRPANALGFTLVEVMITLTVLSLVMLTGAYAFNYMAQNWQRNQASYNRALEGYEDWTMVQRAVSNTFPKVVRENDSIGFYFLGREDGFTAVTQVAVQDPEYPAVYRLFREPYEEGWQLVYEEALLNEMVLIEGEQQLPFGFRQVLGRNLREIEFEYYGWANMAERNRGISEFSEGESTQWFSDYDGIERVQHPLVVQIHIEDFLWPVVVTDITSELLQRTTAEDL